MKKEEKTKLSRERILEAAIVEFGQNGYKAGSTNRICQTGIPKGLLYHNFANKDTLYLACLSRCYSDFMEALSGQPITSLKEYFTARQKFLSEWPLKANLIYDMPRVSDTALSEQIQAEKARFDKFNVELFRKILHTETLRNGITEDEAVRFFMLVQSGYQMADKALRSEHSEDSGQREEEIIRLLDLILYGIAERKMI